MNNQKGISINFRYLLFWTKCLNLKDYIELCKPKVLLLMVLTSVIGMCLATPSWVPWKIFILGNSGIALCAGSAAVINHIADRHIDIFMTRTEHRPVATGRVSPLNALLFALIAGISGLAILALYINPLTAWLTLGSLLGYAFVYTIFLKRVTPQNIVIGGLAGASPPLLGWTAVTGHIHGEGLILVLIIFAWTPPHFWALAIHKKDEYSKASIPMLPVTHGEYFTKVHILLYTIILFTVSLFPWLIQMSGLIYLCVALILGMRFLFWSIVLLRNKRKNSAIKTFRFSIIYLMLLFVALLVDHYIPLSFF